MKLREVLVSLCVVGKVVEAVAVLKTLGESRYGATHRALKHRRRWRRIACSSWTHLFARENSSSQLNGLRYFRSKVTLRIESMVVEPRSTADGFALES